MHGPSSLLALVACLSLTLAAPVNDRRAVVTITKTYVKGMRPTSKPVVVKPAENVQIFKEVPAPALAAVSPPEQKLPSTTSTHSPAQTTTSKYEPAPEAPKPTSKPAGGGKGSGDPNLLTIQITNAMNVAIQTVPGSNREAMGVQGTKFPGPGSLAAGAEGEMIVPRKWAGRIAVLKEGQKMQGIESLIEASFEDNGVALDVSFVDGWTVPIVCSCGGKPLAGCNRDLMKEGTCPNPVNGACRNPKRGTKTNQYSDGADEFFKKCRGAAYTWDTDDLASDHSTCSGVISCCVGTDCPAFDFGIKFPEGIPGEPNKKTS